MDPAALKSLPPGGDIFHCAGLCDPGEYKLRLVGKRNVPETTCVVYRDLDNDSVSEEILVTQEEKEYYTVMVLSRGKILYQWRIRGQLSPGDFLCFGDRDRDGCEDIYVVGYAGDSAVLNWFEASPDHPDVNTVKLVKYSVVDGNINTRIGSLQISDLDGDGKDEFICICTTGYGIFPRVMAVVDFDRDTVLRSPTGCSGIIHYRLFDLTGNGKKEVVFTRTAALGNCRADSVGNDQVSWIMALDHNLQFLFEPVPVGAYPSMLLVHPILSGNRQHLLVLEYKRGMDAEPSVLMLVDLKGNVRRVKKVGEVDYHPGYKDAIMDHKPFPVIMLNSSGIFEVDSILRMTPVGPGEPIANRKFVHADLNGSGTSEYIFAPYREGGIAVYNEDFERTAEFCDIYLTEKYVFSLLKDRGEERRFAINTTHHLYIFKYFRNPLHYFIYPGYIALYGFLVFIFYFLGKLQKARMEQKYSRKRQMSELQLIAVQKQIAPHFTLNLINSIGALMHQQDKARVQILLGKYSRILRYSLMSSDRITVTLAEELEQVRNYLYLERFRMDGIFDFEVSTGPDADLQRYIPKTLVFTFVENAVKHGIRSLEGKAGRISLTLGPEKGDFRIRIEDNGIGRGKAAEHKGQSTGKGLEIIDDMLSLYQAMENTKIRYRIEDLYPGAEYPGTRVEIILPG